MTTRPKLSGWSMQSNQFLKVGRPLCRHCFERQECDFVLSSRAHWKPMQAGKNGRDMASRTRASNETSESILNSLQLLDVRRRSTVQQWVAMSHRDYCSCNSFEVCSLDKFYDATECTNVTEWCSACCRRAGRTTSCCLWWRPMYERFRNLPTPYLRFHDI
jgi:hypothetical protein